MQPVEPTTVKAASLAAATAELQGDYEQAHRNYVQVINGFTEYYKNKSPVLLQVVRQECLKAAAAEKQGKTAQVIVAYGAAAQRFTEQYLNDNPEFLNR